MNKRLITLCVCIMLMLSITLAKTSDDRELSVSSKLKKTPMVGKWALGHVFIYNLWIISDAFCL